MGCAASVEGVENTCDQYLVSSNLIHEEDVRRVLQWHSFKELNRSLRASFVGTGLLSLDTFMFFGD